MEKGERILSFVDEAYDRETLQAQALFLMPAFSLVSLAFVVFCFSFVDSFTDHFELFLAGFLIFGLLLSSVIFFFSIPDEREITIFTKGIHYSGRPKKITRTLDFFIDFDKDRIVYDPRSECFFPDRPRVSDYLKFSGPTLKIREVLKVLKALDLEMEQDRFEETALVSFEIHGKNETKRKLSELLFASYCGVWFFSLVALLLDFLTDSLIIDAVSEHVPLIVAIPSLLIILGSPFFYYLELQTIPIGKVVSVFPRSIELVLKYANKKSETRYIYFSKLKNIKETKPGFLVVKQIELSVDIWIEANEFAPELLNAFEAYRKEHPPRTK